MFFSILKLHGKRKYYILISCFYNEKEVLYEESITSLKKCLETLMLQICDFYTFYIRLCLDHRLKANAS